jgi:predicted nuclease of predicted toxin-antitoxin system
MQKRFHVEEAENCQVVDLTKGHEVIDLTKDHDFIDLTGDD